MIAANTGLPKHRTGKTYLILTTDIYDMRLAKKSAESPFPFLRNFCKQQHIKVIKII